MTVLQRSLALALGLLLAALAPVVAQEATDRSVLARFLEDALTDASRDVRIDGFRGALSARAQFDRLTIADAKGVWLTLSDVVLDWQRSALLQGRVEVRALTAARLEIVRPPVREENGLPSAEARGFALPDLPVSIDIETFALEEIALGKAFLGEAVRLRLDASARYDEAALQTKLDATRIDGKEGRFDVTVDYDRAAGQLVLDIAASEEAEGIAAGLLGLPGEPALDLEIAGTGPLEDYTAQILLASDGTPRLQGQVQVTRPDAANGSDERRRLRADLGGDIATLLAPKYRPFFGPEVALVVDATRLPDGALDIADVSIEAEHARLSGAMRLNADAWPEFMDVKLRIARPDGAPVLLPVGGDETYVSDLDLRLEYDAAQSPDWLGLFLVRDFRRGALRASQASVVLDGVLQGDVDSIGALTAGVTVALVGVEPGSPDLAQALGRQIAATAQVRYVEDRPVIISDLVLSGADYTLMGGAEIDALSSGFDTAFEALLRAEDVSRLSAVMGQPLTGAAQLGVLGRVAPLAGSFDVKVQGITDDLAVGQAQADRLLRGRTVLEFSAERSTEGLVVEGLTLANPALDLNAEAELRSEASRTRFDARLRDTALIASDLPGASSLGGTAWQEAQGWSLDVDFAGPHRAQATLSGRVTGPDALARFTARVPQLRPLVPQISGGLDLSGTARPLGEGWAVELVGNGPYATRATVSARLARAGSRGTFDLFLPDLAALIPELSGRLSAEGRVSQAGRDWQMSATASGPSGARTTAQGRVLSGGHLDIAVNGAAPLGLSAPFVRPRSLTGPAQFDLALRGAPSLAAITGQITTKGAALSAPTLRVGLSDIDSTVRLADGRAELDVRASVSGGGQLEVAGPVALGDGLEAALRVGLRDVAIVDPALYQTRVNGAVTVTGPLAGGARIAGVLDIPETEITVPPSGLTTIGPLPQITHIGASRGVRETQARAGLLQEGGASKGGGASGVAYPLDVLIRAPSRIFVRGRGLDAELGGQLRLTGTTENTIPVGSFELVRGRLDLLGKRFVLDEGIIQLQGALVPFARFVTSTATADGRATITVEGPVDRPEVRFSSNPEAPEDEVLAQLLFGRNIREISAFQALSLANAVATLAGGGAGVIGELRDGFGLDDLDVTQDPEGTTSVTAGKYISDNVYTGVTAGSDGSADVSLNLDLSPSVTAKGTLGRDGDSSIGIFFERDY